jgi:hypothetical protein
MVIRSPFPDIEIPEVPLTDFVLAHASELGDKPAFIDAPSGRTITYAELVDSVRGCAAGRVTVGNHSPYLSHNGVRLVHS